MTSTPDPQGVLDAASIDDAVFALRPDYRAALVVATGIVPAPSDDASEEGLVEAERSAAAALAEQPVDRLPHVAAWRDAYRGFGAKPQRTRPSVEALLRRAEGGLPRVNRLTDLYNAVSVLHRVPLGGEDLTRYAGAPRLVRAVGDEAFDTVAAGEEVVEHPEVGEVVWRDEAGVTCRRWNWRQGRRTALRDDTTSALFVLDALDPLTDAELDAAVADLVARLAALGPDVRTGVRVLRRGDAAAR